MDSAAVVPAMLLSTAVSATTVNAAPAPHQLMPVPADLRLGAGGLPVLSGFTVAVDGHRDDRLLAAISRAMRRLEFPPLLLGALRELVVASAERDRAGDVPPEEWARQVRARAAEAAPPPREQ